MKDKPKTTKSIIKYLGLIFFTFIIYEILPVHYVYAVDKVGLTASGRILAFNLANKHSEHDRAAKLAKILITKDGQKNYIPEAILNNLLSGDFSEAEYWNKELKQNKINLTNDFFKTQLVIFDAVYSWNKGIKFSNRLDESDKTNSFLIDVIKFWRAVEKQPDQQSKLARLQIDAWSKEKNDGIFVTTLIALITLMATGDDVKSKEAKQIAAKVLEESIELQDPKLISLVVNSAFQLSPIEGNKLISRLRGNFESVVSANNWQKELKAYQSYTPKQKAGIMMIFIGVSQLDILPDNTIYFARIAQYLNPESDVVKYWVAKSLVTIDDTVSYNYRIANAYRCIDSIKKNSNMFLSATILRANILKLEDKVKSAISVLREGQKNYKDLPHLYYEEGLLHSENKDHALAIKSYSQGISLFGSTYPENLNYYFRQAIAFDKIDQWKQAEANLQKALKVNPDQPHVLNYLAYSWVIREKNLEQAFDMLHHANELLPGRAFVIDSLGWALYHQKRYEEATEYLEQAVIISPLDPEINDHLGDVYWIKGRLKEARFQWKRSLQFNNGNVEEEGLLKKIKNGL